MSRLNSPGTVTVAATNNVYTAMAAISFLATLGALIFAVLKFREIGVL